MFNIKKFSTEYCAPCKQYDPILTKVEAERSDVVVERIDTHEFPDLAAQYEVQTVPYTVIERDGKPLAGFSGAVNKAKLNQILDSLKEEAND